MVKAANLLQNASLDDCGPGGAVLVKDLDLGLFFCSEVELFLLCSTVFQPPLAMVAWEGFLVVSRFLALEEERVLEEEEEEEEEEEAPLSRVVLGRGVAEAWGSRASAD